MQKINFFSLFSKFYKIIMSFVILIIFFSIYNIFIINRMLENMRFSLEEVSRAYDIGDLDGVDMVLTEAMLEEMEPQTLNSVNLGNLEYAKSVVTRGKSYRQIKSARLSLDVVVKNMEKKRGFVLTALDRINRSLKKIFIPLARLPSYIFKTHERKESPAEADVGLYNKAKDLELEAKLEEAIAAYNDFIKKYPAYERIPLVKLRAAYTYHKMGNYKTAETMYRDIIDTYPLQREAGIAHILLYKLKHMGKLQNRLNVLLIEASELQESEGDTRQNIYYQIGAAHAKLYHLDEAEKFFKRAFNANPASSTAGKSRFNVAWIEKEKYNLDVSTEEFLKLAEESPESTLALDARYQVANIYQQEGDYQKAIDMYLKLAEEYKDYPAASLCIFQAGASYLYDLNDQKKAMKIFEMLKKRYPNSPYSKYLSPENPIGLFVTFVVPRATRVVAWRGAGLVCLSGYSGEIVKFKAESREESFNKGIRDWLKMELPDTVGNIYLDIKDTEFVFKKDRASGAGHIVMGKFEVDGETEGYLKVTDEGSIKLVITKAILEKIPIPPILINMALSGLFLIVEKYFPVTITDLTMNEGVIYINGFGSKRMLSRIRKSAKDLLAVDIATEKIKDPKEEEDLYALYKEKFPWSSFSPSFDSINIQDLFLDFFTRMYFYSGFKLLETIKDSKLDYERSIRTFGKLEVKKEKFKVAYKEEDVNASLGLYVLTEFPWIMDNKYLFDIKGLDLHFESNGEIRFESYLSIGYHITRLKDARSIKVEGKADFMIDKESGIPYLLFKEVYLNNKPFPEETLNKVSSACFNMLKDGHIPFSLEELRITENKIVLKGTGADDFIDKIFSDPHLFVIFKIRPWDLYIAGIQRIRPMDYTLGDRWLKNLPDTEIRRLLRERPGKIEEEVEKTLQQEESARPDN